MTYLVRYKGSGNGPRTESVEANSPSEAMIKFRVSHPGFANGSRQQVVTSVSPEFPVCDSDIAAFE
ncbi:MAG: hypothetical protein KAR11_06920 [Phycisphaerae bacterium]|nr:hypothetical protein [Phycisphaerae bacterium]